MEAKFHCSHSAIFSSAEYRYTRTFIYPQYTIDVHTHGFYELNIVLSGEGQHDFEDLSCQARPGCVFLIPPDIRHGYTSKKDLTVFHLVLHRDFLRDCFGEFQQTAGFLLLFETEPYLRAHYQENMFLVLTEEEMGMIRNDIAVIETCRGMEHGGVYADTVAKKILCYLCLLMTQRQGIGQINPEAGKTLGVISESLNYIHQNFNEKLTLSMLAQRANMSRSTFIRQFEGVCGCSPHRYIQQYRLKKACQYLRDGSRSLTEVAAECGFYDASHLRKQLGADLSMGL